MKIWSCKIGETDEANLPYGADLPMRQAVEKAYWEITGEEAAFTFSGWGAELTEGERAAHEDRLPRWELTETGIAEAATARAERAEAAIRQIHAKIVTRYEFARDQAETARVNGWDGERAAWEKIAGALELCVRDFAALDSTDPPPDAPNWRQEAAEAITLALCSAWPVEIGSDLVFAEQVGHVAASALSKAAPEGT